MPTVSSLKEIAAERIAGAEEVLERFSSGIKAVNEEISSYVFYTRERVKSVASILNKIRIKRRIEGRARYSIDEIGDIAGYRIVTLYDDQLPQVFCAILRTISAFSSDVHVSAVSRSVSSARLIKRRGLAPLFKSPVELYAIRKIKVYRRQPTGDDFYNRLLRGDWYDEKCPISKEQLEALIDEAPWREDSYSSIHILTHAISYDLGIVKIVPMEIQIRTAIEDIWCEVSHGNKYKAKDLFYWSKDVAKDFDSITTHTGEIKKHVDGVSQGISQLRSSKRSIDENIKEYYRLSDINNDVSAILDLANNILGFPQPDPQVATELALICDRLRSLKTAPPRSRRRSADSICKRIDQVSERLQHLAGEIKVEKLNEKSGSIIELVKYDSYLNASFVLNIERLRLGIIYRNSNEKQEFWVECLRELEALELDHKQKLESIERNSSDYNSVNPRAFINYLKYLISDRVKVILDGNAFLSSAFELLDYDKTIAKNSILRIRIRREYARRLWDDADREEKTISELGIQINARSEGLKYRFINAFSISTRNLIKHQELSERNELRDDLGSSAPEVEIFYSREMAVRTYLSLRNFMNRDQIYELLDGEGAIHNRAMDQCIADAKGVRGINMNTFLFIYECAQHIMSERKDTVQALRVAKEYLNECAQSADSGHDFNPSERKTVFKFMEDLQKSEASDEPQERLAGGDPGVG